MGEPKLYTPSNNLFSVIMRNSRGKLFMSVALFFVLCFIIFLLSKTHKSLKELEGVNEKCQQQRDSLSAQLQVVYEHKNRLEKSLQQEKTDHRHTHESNEKQLHQLESKLQQEKDKILQLENQITQLKASYTEMEEEKAQAENSLKEQMQSMQSQKNSEIEKLQNQISELLSEKDKIELENNAFNWKLEKQTGDVSACHLHLQQAKEEATNCQAQLLKCTKNTSIAPISNGTSVTNSYAKTGKQSQHFDVKTESKKTAEDVKTPFPMREKPDVLKRPQILSINNAAEGVLPQPLDLKPDNSIKDIDAANEVNDEGRKVSIRQASNHIHNVNKESIKHEEKDQGLNPVAAIDKAFDREQENNPQVPLPHFDNVGDKEDHAGERGDFGNMFPQFGGSDAKQQLEQPAVHDSINRRKNVIPNPRQVNNDVAAAQMQDMMNKSPGNVNHAGDLNAPRDLGPADRNKLNPLRNIAPLGGRADGHNAIDDKHYEEDDDDHENDDEPANGAGQGLRGNMFQDNDFEDQDNQDNMDNAKEEEGVVVAPK